ncbi:MAG TPA: amidohydrolase family protein [Candidatus Binataceae bacterium]|nr:amidohydrolase family protein [Candidatus Binataceae bacterium]
MLDLKITGGTIVDGTGAPRYVGDVGIKDGRIAAIGVVDDPARETIDAKGEIVAPGFVDIHTHYDVQVFWDPTLSPSSYHGVTTIIGGYCGFSVAPITPESGRYLMRMLSRVEGMPLESLEAAANWNWSSFADYLGRFDGKLAINAGFLVGHSAIRRYVMGEDANKREATRAELERMKALIRESIRGGALGFSTSLAASHNDLNGHPVPSRFASREEVMELYSVVSEFEGTTAEIVPCVEFADDTYQLMTDISLAAQRPVNWNAVGIASASPDEIESVEMKLGATDYARERGAEVIALTVPVSGSVRINLVSGFIFDFLEGWAPFFRLPVAERIAALRDPAYRERLKTQALSTEGRIQNMSRWDRLKVMEVFSEPNQRYRGRLIRDVATEEGRDPFDVFVDIVLADELKTSFSPVYPEETAEIYRARAKLWNDSRAVVGASDAGAHLDMIDSFSLSTGLIQSAVRKFNVASIEEVVHQLTQRPAQLVGLRDRGMLKAGAYADIVIFDADRIGRSASYTRADMPAGGARLYADAQGIHRVIVNGREVIRDNQYLGVPAGAIIRPGVGTYTVNIPGAR